MQNDLGSNYYYAKSYSENLMPMECDAVEFFSMADFTNPGILGTVEYFRKTFQSPILNGREPDADEKSREKGQVAQVVCRDRFIRWPKFRN